MLSYYLSIIETEEDRSKFTEMYIEYKGLMYSAAFEILHNVEDAEDAVHTAFCEVAEHMEKVDKAISNRTKHYLVTIVESRAKNVWNARKRHKEVPYDDETVGIHVEYTGENILASCLQELPARYRELISFKYEIGLTNREIAKIMGLSQENIYKIDQRARKKLYDLCKEKGLVL